MINRLDLLKKIKAAAFLEGEFVTRAGKKTNYYIDKYLFETKPEILDAVTDSIKELLPPLDSFDRIGAPELGAVALAALTAVKVNKPFLIVKKQSKDYGTQRLIEGEFKPGERIVVLEDVLTTGGAVLKAVDVLLANQLKIIDIIGVINREEGAFENISQKGFSVKALFNKTELFNC